uniref:Uncharacterized protein n=1 Tax=Cucumis melo TaxID=3656 RepID=A0A9I9CG00_CUCME
MGFTFNQRLITISPRLGILPLPRLGIHVQPASRELPETSTNVQHQNIAQLAPTWGSLLA